MSQEPPVIDSRDGGNQPFETKKIDSPTGVIINKPDPTLTEQHPTGALKSFYKENRIYVWAIIIGLAIIGTLAYIALRKTPPVAQEEAKVIISVDVPQAIPAGGEAIYKIKIENQDSEKLVGMSLEAAYPSGVTYETSSPKADNLSGSLFKVPDLIQGQNAVITIKARVSGNINDTKDLNLKLHYKFSNFNSEFVKQQTATIRLAASSVDLKFSGPSTTNNAQLVIYTLSYENESEENIPNSRIKITYPEGFNFASATPQPDSGSDTWNIGTLAKKSSGSITIQGSFRSANAGESKTFSADLLVLGQNGDYFTQGTATYLTSISKIPLLVSQELENSSTHNVVDPGDGLTFKVKYQNNASTAAKGVNIIATLDSKALDLSSLQSEGGVITGNTILWNAASVANLETINPSDSGELSFSISLKNPATKDSSKNLSVVSSIKIKSNEYETYFPGNELTLKISSPSNLGSSLKFVTGDLPPEVGKQTLYKVSFFLTNSSNDYSNGVLTAFIPLGAGGYVDGSVNAAESAKVDYDQSTGKLTWNAGPLAAYTGKFSQARVLEFSVRIIPSAAQQGQSPVLVKDIQYNATDTYTSQTIKLTKEQTTTANVNSDNYENGIVR